ncbi:hypothetical protein HQR03_05035 [Psychrobacter okhotskensis]|uniref:hypothetical protein n=1 Tax=Psychrobacter okhotskensis TaxID=212403 RepID=UPI0015673CC9|nr:hypothetical protein [Psychrobacter okhotskensis]NRD69897.1 hypothetical protein [Psychrobacter okhotskensis]
MQKLKKGQVLKYTIDLYLSNKHMLSILALGLLIFPLYYYGLPIAKDEGWFFIIVMWLSIILIAVAVFTVLFAFITGKPVFQITDKGITILQVLRRPQQRYLLWQDIECIGIDCRVIKRHEIWLLMIQPKQGKIIQYPIRSMRYKDAILNEVEVVHLVQLASEGRSAIHYEPIGMERIKLITPRVQWLLLALIFLCIVFYLFFMIK